MRTTYQAIVEVATTSQVDEDAMRTTLAEYGACVGTSSRGWSEIRLVVTAVSLGSACHTAIAVATALTGEPALACEVMTTQESEGRGAPDVLRPVHENGTQRRGQDFQAWGRASRA